ncbi:hypothetical protein EXS54_01540 [Patescibacteria group bacterium]|nr:hypothetical protein [Patescibacteria group bacterium]
MPTVNVTERKVSPRLDQGLLTGLIAGGVVWVWMLLIGALGGGSAAEYAVNVSGFVLGNAPLNNSSSFGVDWLIGTAVHFVTWALIGIVWALIWPKIRRYGIWTPALLFGIVMYLIVEQFIGRLINAEVVNAIGFSALWIGYILAGFVFAFRYRKA